MVSLPLTAILLCCVSSSLADYSNDSGSTTDANDATTGSETNVDDSELSDNSSELADRSWGTVVNVGKGIVKETMKQGMAVGAELLTSQHDHADGKVNVPAKTLAGVIAGKATGSIIGSIPIVPNVIQGGVSHVAQVVGDQSMIGITDLIGKYTLKDVMEFASKGLKSLGLPPLIPTSGKRSDDENQPHKNQPHENQSKRKSAISGISNEPVPLKTIENGNKTPSQFPTFVPPPPITIQYKSPPESISNPAIMSPGRNDFPNNFNPSHPNSPIYNVYQLPQQIGTFNMYNNIAPRIGGDNFEAPEESNITTTAFTSSTTTIIKEKKDDLDYETIA